MYTESVQENDLNFPIINYFVAMEGQPYSAFLAQAMASKGVSKGTFLLNWKKSRRKTSAKIGHFCSVDASFFPALMLTDTKTNMKEENNSSMHIQQPEMSVVQSVSYFVIH